ncbi:MAG: 30S ribosomal protein S3 [Nanoarchaeota archaeon]
MIERKFVSQNMKEHQIKEYVRQSLQKSGLSDVKVQRTPLGERILISASRPGLVVGRGGANIANLTRDLKQKFKLENPQIEIEEIGILGLDPFIVAEMIASSLERFGPLRFKGIGHRAMTDVMNAGAMGVEIFISGKIPSSRAKTWRFYNGYLKKCGEIATTGVKTAYASAFLKTGVAGVKVSIMPPDTKLPDRITIREIGAGVEEVKNDGSVKSEIEKETGEAVIDAKEEGQEDKESKESKEKKAKPKKEAKSKAPKKEVKKPKKAEEAK